MIPCVIILTVLVSVCHHFIMKLKVVAVLLIATTAAAFPAKLLRTPKIYNALITSKEKILPSEAYPATTGPIFQPIGLPGQPLILPPSLIIGGTKPVPVAGDGTGMEMQLAGKPPLPVTFFPRYSLYYAHQPYLTLQHPVIYNAYEVPDAPVASAHQKAIPRELALEERKDLSLQKKKAHPPQQSTPSFLTMEYVKNNRPADINIPDIPPPPPPIRYREEEETL